MYAISIVSATAALLGLATAAPLEPRAAKYPGPKGSGNFNLEVIATAGQLGFSGNWLIPYHTGAGTNVLTLINDQTEAQKFTFNTSTGDVTAMLGSYPAWLGLTTTDLYAPPKGYTFPGFDIVSGPGHNFTFTSPDNYLHFPAGSKYTWSVCPAQIYSQGVYINTLVYRDTSGKTNSSCADVLVKAVF